MKRLRVRFLALMLIAVCGLVAAGRPLPRGEPLTLAAAAPAAATGSIGGYVESVSEVALAVESSGRIHVLWTGELNPYFDTFAFYSTSTDGINWTPYQVLNYWLAYDPQVAVDDTHHRAHLMYRSNYDGILHHTVTNGVASAPTVLDTTGVAGPKMAVDPTTGFVYAAWRQGYYYPLDTGWLSWRSRTWHAYWDGVTWSSRQRVVNNGDTFYPSIAAAPGGGVMLAWFQQWSQSLGGPTDPGKPIVPRTAYGTSPGEFPLRQAVSDPYTIPEKDNSILLTYSPGDDKYYMACDHLMWPGHSRVYRYTWQNGSWSAPLDVAQNTSGWGVPWYVGAAADSPLVTYVYKVNNELWVRTETSGVLSTPQRLADTLAARGYVGSASAFFVGDGGALHVVVIGTKGGVAGFYYLHL